MTIERYAKLFNEYCRRLVTYDYCEPVAIGCLAGSGDHWEDEGEGA